MASPIPVLSIAGSDPTGGAGVQADLRLFAADGLFGTAVIAGLTVQGVRGVTRALPVDAELLEQQLDAVLEALPFAAAKTGMLGSAASVLAVAARAHRVRLVVDPVLVSSSGQRLLSEEGVAALREALLPAAFLITPNLAEAAVLLQVDSVDPADALDAARQLVERGARGAVVTGGHAPGHRVCDAAWIDGPHRFEGERVDTANDHGTGCLHSAAIASALARGRSPVEAVAEARARMDAALRAAVRPGASRGCPWPL